MLIQNLSKHLNFLRQSRTKFSFKTCSKGVKELKNTFSKHNSTSRTRFFVLAVAILSIFATIFGTFSLLHHPVYATFQPRLTPSLTSYVYARAETSGVYLYKSAQGTDQSNILFEIPESYFVGLLSDYNNLFYKVMYLDLTGFVLKSSVTPVKETPETPYLEGITFRVYTPGGTEMVANPTSKSPTVITTVEQNTIIKYYGKSIGQENISGRGSTWYFGTTPTGESGYIYKGLTDQLSHIPLNTEQTTPLSTPFGESNDYLYNLVNISLLSKILIILFTTLPVLLLIYLLLKPYKIEKSLTSHTPKNKLNSKTIRQIEDITDHTI